MTDEKAKGKPKAPKVKLRETAGSRKLAMPPPLPRARRIKKTVPKPCECGCGGETRGGRFIPGHDSKLKAWMLRVERGLMKVTEIEHEGIRNAVRRAMKLGPVDKPKAKPSKVNGGVKRKQKRADDQPAVADAPGSDYDLSEDTGDEDVH